jgi:glycosyltransferase involved in cell wall biosynthesis
MPADITILILTMNEEDNLPKALESVRGFARRVVVVDSGSSDRTREIALEAGADVYENTWVNYANQFNWGLDNTEIDTTWTFRLDADEQVLPELARFLNEELSSIGDGIDGIEIRRRMYFLGRWIKHGGIYPNYMVRIFRTSNVRCELALMDEHMIVHGGVHRVEADIKDENSKPLRWWMAKHNWYSDREVYDIFARESEKNQEDLLSARFFGTAVERKRWFKTNVYNKVPISWRSWLYYVSRYYLKLGFLDGPQGRIYHFLQAYCYRFLVDAKFYEAKKYPKVRDELIDEISKPLE